MQAGQATDFGSSGFDRGDQQGTQTGCHHASNGRLIGHSGGPGLDCQRPKAAGNRGRFGRWHQGCFRRQPSRNSFPPTRHLYSVRPRRRFRLPACKVRPSHSGRRSQVVHFAPAVSPPDRGRINARNRRVQCPPGRFREPVSIFDAVGAPGSVESRARISPVLRSPVDSGTGG